MLKALNTAATGMAAQQHNIDVIANNMANVNTTGFRRSRTEFQDLVYETVRVPGAQKSDGTIVPTGVQIGHGTRVVSSQPIHIQGSLEQTGGPLDIAIEGEGFFVIQRPAGDYAYTRAGNFKTDGEGRVVTADGFFLNPNISIPSDSTNVAINPDGTVSATRTDGSVTEIGRIQLAKFINPAGLQAMGRGQFIPTPASGEPFYSTPGQDGLGTLAHGFLERSNVEVVTEMIDLISSQRAYDINQRVIQAADEMLRKATER